MAGRTRFAPLAGSSRRPLVGPGLAPAAIPARFESFRIYGVENLKKELELKGVGAVELFSNCPSTVLGTGVTWTPHAPPLNNNLERSTCKILRAPLKGLDPFCLERRLSKAISAPPARQWQSLARSRPPKMPARSAGGGRSRWLFLFPPAPMKFNGDGRADPLWSLHSSATERGRSALHATTMTALASSSAWIRESCDRRP